MKTLFALLITVALAASIALPQGKIVGGKVVGGKVAGAAGGGGGPTSLTWINDQNTATSGAGEVHHDEVGFFGMAHSSQTITAADDSYFEWIYPANYTFMYVGASNGTDGAGTGAADLEFAFKFIGVGTAGGGLGFEVNESGSFVWNGDLAINDVFRITFKSNGDVEYKKNGSILTTTVAPSKTFPYRLQFKVASDGGVNPGITTTVKGP